MSENTVHPPVDRTGWPSGPWDDEPDRVEWYDEATNMPCLAKRNRMGAWCGYVAVNPGHPYHEESYEEVPVKVHGGLTYANSCSGSICHVPRPGEPDDVWWFGFDCAHADDVTPVLLQYDITFPDVTPVMSQYDVTFPLSQFAVYRDLDYVKAQCTSLAKQLAELAA